MRQKSITLRLPDDEYRAFTTVCNEKGYSKTGKIREFIRNLVTTEMSEVRSSAGEWERVRERIRSGRSRTNLEKARTTSVGPVRGAEESRGPVLEERRENQEPEAETSTETWKL